MGETFGSWRCSERCTSYFPISLSLSLSLSLSQELIIATSNIHPIPTPYTQKIGQYNGRDY
jgi:hypothetical protein